MPTQVGSEIAMDRRQRTGYLVLAVVLAHVILISVQVNAAPGTSVLQSVTFGAFTELQRWVASGRDGVVDMWSGYVGLRSVRKENLRLNAEISGLRLELQEQPMLQHADPCGEAEEQQRGCCRNLIVLKMHYFTVLAVARPVGEVVEAWGGVASQKHKLPSNDDPAIREKAIS